MVDAMKHVAEHTEMASLPPTASLEDRVWFAFCAWCQRNDIDPLKRGVTKQFCEATKVGESYFSRISTGSRGKKSPDLGRLEHLAGVLEVSVEWLTFGRGKAPVLRGRLPERRRKTGSQTRVRVYPALREALEMLAPGEAALEMASDYCGRWPELAKKRTVADWIDFLRAIDEPKPRGN